jgi:hypothetical protein
MTPEQIGDDPFDPFEIGYARSQLGVLFAELIAERRRISTLIDKARDRNDPRLSRVQDCGKIVDDRLIVWLDRWQGQEPPH